MAFPIIGPRFAVPSTSNAATDFLEMRRVGTYPSELLLAGLTCYVETQLDKKGRYDLKGLWRQGREKTITDVFDREVERRQDQNGGLDNEELQDMLVRVGLWMNENEVWQVPTTGKAIASLQSLQEALQASIQVFVSTQAFPDINLGTVLFPGHSTYPYPKLTLCICEDVIFLLYRYISPDNCIRLSCGHHTFKHLIEAQISEKVGDFTVSEADLAALSVICQTCSQPSAVRLKTQGFQFLLEGPGRTDQNLCCEHQVPPLDRFRCQCNTYQCKECALSRALTVSGPCCQQCGASYLEDLDCLANTEPYQWLRPYLNVITRNKSIKSLSDPPISRPNPAIWPMCKLCNEKTTIGTPCPKRDCCPDCLIQEVCKSNGQFKCPVCGRDVQPFFREERRCSECKEPCRRSDMFFMCARCKRQVCPPCIRKTKDKDSLCSVTKLVHQVHPDKVKSILGTNSKAFR